jgi:hypothetical protein
VDGFPLDRLFVFTEEVNGVIAVTHVQNVSRRFRLLVGLYGVVGKVVLKPRYGSRECPVLIWLIR